MPSITSLLLSRVSDISFLLSHVHCCCGFHRSEIGNMQDDVRARRRFFAWGALFCFILRRWSRLVDSGLKTRHCKRRSDTVCHPRDSRPDGEHMIGMGFRGDASLRPILEMASSWGYSGQILAVRLCCPLLATALGWVNVMYCA